MAGAGFSVGSTLVTGATGFVGRPLCEHLASQGHSIVACVREASPNSWQAYPNILQADVGNISPDTDWTPALNGVACIVHLAARVHVMHECAQDVRAAYRAANTDSTLNLARQAAQAGVRRFVFVSTIKVNGEGRARTYAESDLPNPQDAYALSKWEAEQGLYEIAVQTGMQVVILRPPLVYGPGVKANFLRLMQLVERGWPLPLGAIHNRRSLLYVGNLVSAIEHCLVQPCAVGKTFLVSDGEEISTSDLVRLIASEMGKPARLLPVSPGLIRLAASMLGKRKEADRLLGSLSLDSGKLRHECGWQPPYTMREGLRETVAAYLEPAASSKQVTK